MKRVFDGLSEDARRRLRKRSQPSWTGPMLATLTDEPFSSEEWIYERKLDGERCLAFRRGGKVDLRSRNRKALNGSYPEIVDALGCQKIETFIADGEIVAFEGKRTSFSRLQQRMQIRDRRDARKSDVAVYYYVFDLLHCGAYDLTRLALKDRKKLLKRAFVYQRRLRFTPHRTGKGEEYLREACHKGWEGLIAKRADSRYVHSRSRQWLKFKCTRGQEFVIGGFTDPQGSRTGFGALLVGYYAEGGLRYAGKVGTGYDEDTLHRLRNRLDSLERKKTAFVDDNLPRKGVHWTDPKLVAEVGFTEWTDDGKLRHPRFLGLRRDKNAKSVRREEAS